MYCKYGYLVIKTARCILFGLIYLYPIFQLLRIVKKNLIFLFNELPFEPHQIIISLETDLNQYIVFRLDRDPSPYGGKRYSFLRYSCHHAPLCFQYR